VQKGLRERDPLSNRTDASLGQHRQMDMRFIAYPLSDSAWRRDRCDRPMAVALTPDQSVASFPSGLNVRNNQVDENIPSR